MLNLSVLGIVVFLSIPVSADVQVRLLPSRFLKEFQVLSILQQRDVVHRFRRLQETTHDDIMHGLDGEVELRHEWSCSGECEPLHDRQDVTPGETTEGVDDQSICIEEVATGALERQIDFDLACLGENLTCDEIEMIDYHEELWSNCNQDPDLLYGTCSLMCRFGAHPTRRCTYTFDRANRYGLSATSEGALVWSHCALLTDCDATTLVETMGLYCNRSAIDLPPPEQVIATDAPLPQVQSTTVPNVLTGTETEGDEEGDEDGNGLLIGVIGAAGGTVMDLAIHPW